MKKYLSSDQEERKKERKYWYECLTIHRNIEMAFTGLMDRLVGTMGTQCYDLSR